MEKKKKLVTLIIAFLTCLGVLYLTLDHISDEKLSTSLSIIVLIIMTIIGIYIGKIETDLKEEKKQKQKEEVKKETLKFLAIQREVNEVFEAMFIIISNQVPELKKYLEANDLELSFDMDKEEKLYCLTIEPKNYKKNCGYLAFISYEPSSMLICLNDKDEESIEGLKANEIVNMIVEDLEKFTI